MLNKPKNPTKLKEAVYLLSSAILGILLSFLAHAFIEMNYLSWAKSQNLIVYFYNGCALSPIVQYSLLFAGAIGGLALGRFWWKKLYL